MRAALAVLLLVCLSSATAVNFNCSAPDSGGCVHGSCDLVSANATSGSRVYKCNCVQWGVPVFESDMVTSGDVEFPACRYFSGEGALQAQLKMS